MAYAGEKEEEGRDGKKYLLDEPLAKVFRQWRLVVG